MDRPEKTHGELADRVRAALADLAPAEQKMFGGVCFMLNGSMVAGTLRDGLLLRVGKEAGDAALQRPHARPMVQKGRPAAGYVIVESEGIDRDEDLKGWLDLAVRYVSSLPAKQTETKPRPRRQ
jgi:TfoX/Sxy family transcriptional regulator of competence genes